jgi:histidyl-tRNA synthetase
MKKADRAGIRVAVILGSDEAAAGTVQIRDLRGGTQDEVAQTDLATAIGAMLARQPDGVEG